MTTTPTICFYGDDLTGSTDALANFARWGLHVRMVFDVASVARIGEGADVVGIAGRARSLPSSELEAELSPVLASFAALEPEVIQYKVCSTFDSSPSVGSIGRVCELASSLLGRRAIPVLAAQPDLGRFTVYSNHFARAFDGRVYRLDRHPTVSAHPVTPMREADLCRILEEQTSLLRVRGLHLAELNQYPQLSTEHDGPIVLDALDNADLRQIGRLIRSSRGASPIFGVGSGGLSYALGSTFEREPVALAPLGAAGAVMAISGSCSIDTALQIRAAVSAGWDSVDVVVLGPEAVVDLARASLQRGHSVVVHSALGTPPVRSSPHAVASALSEVAARVLAGTAVRRLLVAGGDTAGAVMRVLGGDGLEYLGPIGTDCAICELRSASRELDGLQVVLKGGQVGGPDFFEQVRLGL